MKRRSYGEAIYTLIEYVYFAQDEVPIEIISMLHQTSNDFLLKLLPKCEDLEAANNLPTNKSGSYKGKYSPTVLTKFKVNI